MPILPGLVRYDEVAAGVIDHAIRVTFSQTQRGFILPATHFASSNPDPTLPAMGMRLRLRADFNIAALTGQARVIAAAMQRYGLIVADNGSNWFFQGAPDPGWNDNDLEPVEGDSRYRVRGRRHRSGANRSVSKLLAVSGQRTLHSLV